MTQTVEAAAVVPPAELRPRSGLDLAASASAESASADPAPPSPPSAPKITAAAAESATRLLVEPGKGAEGFVYKLVDRTTGQILSEFPREAASSLAQSNDYQAGAVLDESA